MTSVLHPSENACRLRVGFVSDAGRVRERNEDSYALYLAYQGEAATSPVDAYFAVADGMGGHQHGDLASRYITDAIGHALTAPEPDFADRPETLGAWMRVLVHRINRGLIELGVEKGASRSMGSTLTLAILWRRTMYLGHVGDTRCYRLRAGELRQLTEDHSWVADQLRAGLLTEEEAAHHPNRNWLTQCLGIDEEPDVYLLEQPVLDGDRYVLCSDGLHGEIPDAELTAILREEPEPQAAARRLVEAANGSGGPDNITAIVFDVAVPPAEPRPAPPLPPQDRALAATLPGLESPPLRTVRRRRTTRLMLLVVATAALVGTWLIGTGRTAPAIPAVEEITSPTDAPPQEGNASLPAAAAPSQHEE